ncbi:polyketide cyclase/dehydrase and lipid transport superfamily protein [Artemisia annua]|uniref:Polyketide cyclase/dehydrase and lipid transport superfamily protein n=1 Tax=Artemisia annua TaxID=35608 RepID=A0A2U1M5K6_ARTAN|nr:polyketide cyclase/dehydrase and lipid transport superfamily protein [Artemisia annua]
MAEETTISKWKGKATTQLKNTPPQQIWPLFQDFCSLHKWLPTIDTCHHVEGQHGQPGLVRYCASTVPSSNGETIIKWCHEKLVSIDPIQRCLSYEIVENNLGFTYYVVEIKVNEVDDGGCMIEWSFEADPIQGWRLEDLCGYIESSLKAMGEKMEMELQGSTN